MPISNIFIFSFRTNIEQYLNLVLYPKSLWSIISILIMMSLSLSSENVPLPKILSTITISLAACMLILIPLFQQNQVETIVKPSETARIFTNKNYSYWILFCISHLHPYLDCPIPHSSIY